MQFPNTFFKIELQSVYGSSISLLSMNTSSAVLFCRARTGLHWYIPPSPAQTPDSWGSPVWWIPAGQHGPPGSLSGHLHMQTFVSEPCRCRKTKETFTNGGLVVVYKCSDAGTSDAGAMISSHGNRTVSRQLPMLHSKIRLWKAWKRIEQEKFQHMPQESLLWIRLITISGEKQTIIFTLRTCKCPQKYTKG